MKIVHYITYLAPADGHVAYCMRLSQELLALGHGCEVVTGECCAGYEAPAALLGHVQEVRPHGFRARGHVYDPRYAWRLAKAFKALKPDVVHLHGFWSPLVAAAITAARRCAIPVILSPHGALGEWVCRRNRLQKRILSALRWKSYHREVASYHVTSELEAADLRRAGLAPAAIVPIGVDLPLTREPSASPPAQMRTMLYLSRMHPKKGLENWARAWDVVRPKGWRMRIVGCTGDTYEAAVRRVVRELNLESVFSFDEACFGPARSQAYWEADAFVLPSLTENFGMVVTEALAHGVPVITTTATPWEELSDRQCGWCVAPTVEALAGALRLATWLPAETLREMGARGRAWMAQDFQWSALASRMVKEYDAVIGLRTGRTHARGESALDA